MSTKKQASTKRVDLESVFSSAITTSEEPPAPRAKTHAPRLRNIKQHSLYLPEAAHQQLRKLAFEEDRKMHDYFMEGLDRVFEQRGLKSLKELGYRKEE